VWTCRQSPSSRKKSGLCYCFHQGMPRRDLSTTSTSPRNKSSSVSSRSQTPPTSVTVALACDSADVSSTSTAVFASSTPEDDDDDDNNKKNRRRHRFPSCIAAMSLLQILSSWKGARECAKAQLQMGIVLVIAYVGNNWPVSYPRNDNHHPNMFWLMNGILLLFALGSMHHSPSTRGVQLRKLARRTLC
jgi:hypothetical protein